MNRSYHVPLCDAFRAASPPLPRAHVGGTSRATPRVTSRFTPYARVRAGARALSALVWVAMLTAAAPAVAGAQGSAGRASAPPVTAAPSSPPPQQAAMADSAIKAFAALHVAISQVQDSADARLAQSKNKTLSAQQELRDKLTADVNAAIIKSGLTLDEYKRRRFVVSTNGETRRKFDVIVAQLTGQPTPGLAPVAAVAPPSVAVPTGPSGVHIGHVVNAFPDTPGGVGLLPIALAEAKTAAQHATLASRTPTDLAMMKLHAGHVLNALDPSVEPKGPGKGYGVKRATAAVAMHIELAAKADPAAKNVGMHAPHIATAARSTGARADQIIVIAKQIQNATDAAVAAGLVSQMMSLCDQLVAGADLNSDGRINWDGGEGGLQQVQQHVNLMLAAKP